MKKFTSAIILAAGSGTRFGGEVKKQFIEVGGLSSVQRCALAFEKCDLIDELIFVGNVEEISRHLDKLSLKKLSAVVEGGTTRQKSALKGFDAISSKAKYVAIHDAARCLITPDIITETVNAAYKHRASLAAEKAIDTVKVIDENGYIINTINRENVWLAKTPQVFLADMYRVAAYTAAQENFEATDDCMLCERLGFKIVPVNCGQDNIKLTNPEDLPRAIEILKRRGEL